MQTWWYELALPRLGLRRVADRTRDERTRRIAHRFAALAVRLGGLMIKVGQFLSSRLDVLPPEVTSELESLQDAVPAAPFAEVAALAERELGVPLAQVFADIDTTPIAAASLGQAYRARLGDEDAGIAGFRDVVVKVQRPGIDDIVAVDLAALRRVAAWLSRVAFIARRVDVTVLVEEFATTSLAEIDYIQEAANAEHFTTQFADDDRVSTPAVVWERTTRRVIVLADVTAIKITDVDALRAAGIDPAAVAEEFADVMFGQVFGDGFFHADPHGGNVFVTPDGTSERGWHLTFIDFGMMGQVPAGLRHGLRHVVIAAAARDGRGLVAGIQGVGMLLPDADTAELERALTELFSRFGGMGFAELQDVDRDEYRDFAEEFGEVVRALPFQLPDDFLLIVRAISMTSGVCSALDPAFNIWHAIEPFATRIGSEESRGVVRDLATRAGGWVRTTSALPGRLDSLITRVESGKLSVQTPTIDARLDRLDRSVRRVVSAVVFAALLVGGILLRLQDAGWGTVLMALAVLPAIHLVVTFRRSAGRPPSR